MECIYKTSVGFDPEETNASSHSEHDINKRFSLPHRYSVGRPEGNELSEHNPVQTKTVFDLIGVSFYCCYARLESSICSEKISFAE